MGPVSFVQKVVRVLFSYYSIFPDHMIDELLQLKEGKVTLVYLLPIWIPDDMSY